MIWSVCRLMAIGLGFEIGLGLAIGLGFKFGIKVWDSGFIFSWGFQG